MKVRAPPIQPSIRQGNLFLLEHDMSTKKNNHAVQEEKPHDKTLNPRPFPREGTNKWIVQWMFDHMEVW